jgi:cysteine desulfurase / selenocysteine lyase
MIYLDYAATSWPKPPEVVCAMSDFLEQAGGNPGRSGHRLSIAAGRIVYQARESVAELFHAPDPMRVVFTSNVTYALNLALKGLLRPGSRAVTTGMEHNSVMRPLRAMEKDGVQVAVAACHEDGSLDFASLEGAVIPGTRLVVVTHASNVVGTILPVRDIAAVAHRAGALLLVDAAQTAGVVPIDQQADGIDLLAFTGHKGLHGPPGTGGLVIGSAVSASDLLPLVRGGTGSRSESHEQPDVLPDKYESGTPNGVGIAGLGAGVRWVLTRGVDAIRAHEAGLADALLEGLREVPEVTLYGPADSASRTSVISCRVANQHVSDVGLRLDEEFGILCRVGLHCAPSAHKTIGTFPEGTIRLAPGAATSLEDVRTAVGAIRQLARQP